MLTLPGLPSSLHYGNLVNRASPLNRGLVAWWLTLPQRGKGNTFFDIAGPNHGTLTNGATWGGQSLRGGYGSVTGDGTNDVITTNATVTGTFSVSCNVCLLATPSFSYIVGEQSSFKGIRFPSLAPSWCDAAGDTTSPTSFVVGDWHRVLATIDGTNATVYVDGIQKVQSATTVVDFDDGGLRMLARTAAGSNGINARVDSVKLWNRVLSASDAWNENADAIRGYPQTLNRLRSYTVFDVGGGAPPATRSGDLLLLGCGA